MFVYGGDADELFDRAVSTGATELMPMEVQRDGDPRGGVTDPFGHVWWIATQTEDLSRAEIRRCYDGLTEQ